MDGDRPHHARILAEFSLAAVASDDDFVREIGLAQRAQRKFLVGRIVLDEENYLLSDGGFLGIGQPSGEPVESRKSGYQCPGAKPIGRAPIGAERKP